MFGSGNVNGFAGLGIAAFWALFILVAAETMSSVFFFGVKNKMAFAVPYLHMATFSELCQLFRLLILVIAPQKKQRSEVRRCKIWNMAHPPVTGSAATSVRGSETLDRLDYFFAAIPPNFELLRLLRGQNLP